MLGIISSRFWESFSSAMCCKSLVVVFGNNCLLQIGAAAKSSEGEGSSVAVDINKLMQGSLYQSCMQSSKRMNYKLAYVLIQKTQLKGCPNCACTRPHCCVISTCYQCAGTNLPTWLVIAFVLFLLFFMVIWLFFSLVIGI